jgi:Uma2 family endonuclease
MTTTAPKKNGLRPLSPVEAAREAARIFPITVEQYHQMIEQGIVPEDSTVELIRGMLVRKDRGIAGEHSMGHSPLHRAIVTLLTQLAARLQSAAHYVQIQLPISCPPDSEPEPDAAIIRGQPRDYLDHFPGPGDVSCVIEAAHSSLDRDREDKLPVYAAAGIPQYIIVNLQNVTLEVHADPDPSAEVYRSKVTVDRNGQVALRLPAGEITIDAGELLP